MLSKIKNNGILIVGLMFLFIVIIGTIGYMVIEHYNLLEAIYFTISAVTTMGFDFGGTHTLSAGGKVFSIIIMLFGATIFIFAAGFLADSFFSSVMRKKQNEPNPELSSEMDFFNGDKEDMRLAVIKIQGSQTKIDFLNKYGVVVIGIEKSAGIFDVKVPFTAKLKNGTNAIVMGTEKQIRELAVKFQ